jgi:hypothetical protein
MVITMVIGGLVLATVWEMAAVLQAQRQTARERSATTSSGLQLRTTLAKSFDEMDSGLLSAPNWSPVQAQIQDTPDGPQDVLIVFRAAGDPMRNSTQACQQSSDPNCIRLVGDHRANLQTGDLLLVGNAETGARLVQVRTLLALLNAPCGADCPVQLQTCSLQAQPAPLQAPVVVQSRRYDAGGNLVSTSGAPCPQSFWPDGSRCEETVQSQNVGSRTDAPCTALATPQQAYTEIVVDDRTTAPFGYPQMSTFTYRSGGSATPRVTTQKVRFARYLLTPGSAGKPSLMRQINLTASGTWGVALPVASDIADFQVEVVHAGESAYVRGTGITPGMLAVTTSNTNYVRSSAPGPDGTAPSRAFRRSYATIAGVRVSFTAVSRNPLTEKSQEYEKTRISFIRATPSVVGGGASSLAD